VYSV